MLKDKNIKNPKQCKKKTQTNKQAKTPKTVDLFTFRITSVMNSEQLFVAEPEFLNNQQVIGFGDTDDSGDNSQSYCICERQAERADDLDDFNTAKCNLTQSTQFCSASSQSAEEPLGAFYNSGLHCKNRS